MAMQKAVKDVASLKEAVFAYVKEKYGAAPGASRPS